VREADRWTILSGCPAGPDAAVRISDENAWRLLFNALSHGRASAAIEIEGNASLVQPLLSARSVIV